jgi:O-antigen/teichoic acid export membrane protein
LGIIVDQSFKGTIYSYIGVVLGFATTLLFSRIPTNEIGLTRILSAYSVLIAQIGTLGINGVIIRYFPVFRDEKQKHHGFLSLILLGGLIGFIISTALFFLLKSWIIQTSVEKSSLFVEYINWLIVLVFFQIFFAIFDGYYTALYNSVHGTFLKDVFQRILIILILGLYMLNLISFHQFILYYIVSLSIPTLIILFTLIREKHFSLHTEFHYLNKELSGQMLSMAAFSIFNSLSVVLIQNIDSLMINSMIGIDEVGIYTICFNFGIIVGVPARSIYKIANVVAAQAWKNNDMKVIRDIYYKSCLTLFIIGILLFIGVWGNLHNVFRIVGEEKFISGKWVIFFFGLGALIDLTTGANSSILGSSRYYKVQSIFLIILVVLIVLSNYLLIPVYGITGAAIGSAFSLTILNILRFLFLYYKYNLQPFNWNFLVVLVIAVLAYLISTLIPPFHNLYLDIIIRSGVITLLFGLPVYLLKISEDLNQKTDQYLRLIWKS